MLSYGDSGNYTGRVLKGDKPAPRPLLQQTSNHYLVAMRIRVRRVIAIMPSASHPGAL